MYSEYLIKRALHEAEQQLNSKNPERALALCERILVQNPSHEQAHILRINILHHLMSLEDLLKEIERSLKSLPNSAEIWFLKGIACSAISVSKNSTEQMRTAVESYLQCMELNRKHYRAIHFLGTILYNCGEKENGLTFIEHAASIEPSYQEGFMSLFNIYCKEGRYADAALAGEKASVIFDQNPHNKGQFGKVLFRICNYARARVVLSEYIRYMKDMIPQIRYAFPICLDRQLYKNLTRVTSADEDFITSTYLRAICGIIDGEKQSDRFGSSPDSELEKILAKYPDHSYSHAGLSIKYFIEGDLESACKAIDRALCVEPTEDLFLTAKAFYLTEIDKSLALEYIEQVLQRRPDDLRPIFVKLWIMQMQGDSIEASKLMKKIAQRDPFMRKFFDICNQSWK